MAMATVGDRVLGSTAYREPQMGRPRLCPDYRPSPAPPVCCELDLEQGIPVVRNRPRAARRLSHCRPWGILQGIADSLEQPSVAGIVQLRLAPVAANQQCQGCRFGPHSPAGVRRLRHSEPSRPRTSCASDRAEWPSLGQGRLMLSIGTYAKHGYSSV